MPNIIHLGVSEISLKTVSLTRLKLNIILHNPIYFQQRSVYRCCDRLYYLHNRGWRSVYCVTIGDSSRGKPSINLTDRLIQVLKWAKGSVKIFSLATSSICNPKNEVSVEGGVFQCGKCISSIFLLVYWVLPALHCSQENSFV